jgi:hypothetical protein
MKRHLVSDIAGVAVALFSLAASDAFAQESYKGREWHMPVFERVRKDLIHASASAIRGSDKSRIDHTVLQLTEMQGDLSEYWRNEHEFDDLLGSLRKVVTENRLSPQDRQALTDDLAQMRAFRENRAAWR